MELRIKIDHAGLQANREKHDQLARDSALKSMTKKNTPEKPPISLKELARRVGMDRSACRRYVLSLGYKPTKQRMPDSGYQLALTVSAIEAFEIQARRASEGYCNAPR